MTLSALIILRWLHSAPSDSSFMLDVEYQLKFLSSATGLLHYALGVCGFVAQLENPAPGYRDILRGVKLLDGQLSTKALQSVQTWFR